MVSKEADSSKEAPDTGGKSQGSVSSCTTPQSHTTSSSPDKRAQTPDRTVEVTKDDKTEETQE
eukprot:7061992-Karenia_brevis.AAC.1